MSLRLTPPLPWGRQSMAWPGCLFSKLKNQRVFNTSGADREREKERERDAQGARNLSLVSSYKNFTLIVFFFFTITFLAHTKQRHTNSHHKQKLTLRPTPRRAWARRRAPSHDGIIGARPGAPAAWHSAQCGGCCRESRPCRRSVQTPRARQRRQSGRRQPGP